ncbi:MAG: ATP-binding protein [Agathobacter sp.]|nr:ATP-binding protein [Agathobacter sp.]
MEAKKTDLAKLEELYKTSGNQLVVMYGRKGCQKEQLIREFISDKKYFYYRCRQASALEQSNMMAREIENQFDVKLQKHTYEEYFSRVKTGNPSKLVVVIDEAQYIVKKDPEFTEAIKKLKNKRLYPGPVMIILASSSMVWVRQDAEELFKTSMKIEELNFLEVVRSFPTMSVPEIIKTYGVLGGVPAYLEKWDSNASFKENVCKLILSENGALFTEAEDIISSELRELSVYNTILATIARGQNKLNDLFHETGFSRAKISVYMKNLAQFDIVEKVISFETGGWDNAKKGVYQIKDTFVNFWFKFVYPNQSDLYTLSAEDFYDKYVEPDLDDYLNRYFRNVCMEYLMLLDQMEQLPFKVHKVGTWLGKTGTIDIIAQSTDRRNIIGFCNWTEPELTMDMCEKMAEAMDKARLSSDNYYLFSATSFEPALETYVTKDPRFKLINMNEL